MSVCKSSKLWCGGPVERTLKAGKPREGYPSTTLGSVWLELEASVSRLMASSKLEQHRHSGLNCYVLGEIIFKTTILAATSLNFGLLIVHSCHYF
jgi:hypothetical protein